VPGNRILYSTNGGANDVIDAQFSLNFPHWDMTDPSAMKPAETIQPNSAFSADFLCVLCG
jgi:hypothetical protein